MAIASSDVPTLTLSARDPAHVPLLVIALAALACALAALHGAWQWLPAADAMFSSRHKRASLVFEARKLSPPAGPTLVLLRTQGGAVYFTDCAAMPWVCDAADGDQWQTQMPMTVDAVFLPGGFVWPVAARMVNTAVLTPDVSEAAYVAHRRREIRHSVTWLVAAVALAGWAAVRRVRDRRAAWPA